MGKDTKIEWCHHTFNCWRGCTKVSAACANCYAEKQAKRNPSVLGIWGDSGTRVVAAESAWREPLKWDKAAKEAGERHRVFCASMADVFEDWQGEMRCSGGTPSGVNYGPLAQIDGKEPLRMQDVRRRLFALIDQTPNLDWLLLTKRPQNVLKFMPLVDTVDGECVFPSDRSKFRPNVWIGTTVEDQKTADERIPHLWSVPAKIRFLSCEPLLGPVDLSAWIGPKKDCQYYDKTPTEQRRNEGVIDCCRYENPSGKCKPGFCPFGYIGGISWVIAGGESGPHARPSHPDWFRSLQRQCAAAGVPFFFKQWGEWSPMSYANSGHDLHRFDGNGGEVVARVGKAAAGRELAGREWNEVPS